jgi:hypothetical protein
MARNQADLSPELLSEVFSYFDTAAPSIFKLRLQPDLELTSSPIIDLKSISCVSWRWRQIVLRTLFKNVRILLKWDGGSGWALQIEVMLKFLRRSQLASIVESFTIAFTTTGDGRRFPIERLPSDSVDSLFRSTFETIDPSRLTIVAPPEILCFLVSCSLRNPAFDYYHMPHQILSLTRPRFMAAPYVADPKSTILSIRPWSNLLLSEGSFLRAYSVCGADPRPPSILPDLVSIHGKSKRFVLPFNIRDFCYIAIHPFSFHFQLLEKLLSRLRRLYIQLIPRNDLAPNQRQTAQVLDLVDERDSCYESVMRWALDPEKAKLHRYLREIECGDNDVEPAWAFHLQRYDNVIRTSKINVR